MKRNGRVLRCRPICATDCFCKQAVMRNRMACTKSRTRIHLQVTRASYPQAQAVRRSLKRVLALPSAGDMSRLLDSLYVVFNHHLVLPEYIVEYELVCFMDCAPADFLAAKCRQLYISSVCASCSCCPSGHEPVMCRCLIDSCTFCRSWVTIRLTALQGQLQTVMS